MDMRWRVRDVPRRRTALLDPCDVLANATQGASYGMRTGPGARDWFPVMLELAVTARQFASGIWYKSSPPDDWQDWLRIPAVYASPPSGLNRITFCTATVRPKFFEFLKEDSPLRRTVRRFELGVPHSILTQPFARIAPLPLGRSAPRVVVTGVIDESMAFAQDRFLRPDGTTRVEYVWNQGDAANSVPGFGYGRELRKRDVPGEPGIDRRLQNARYAGLLDEDELYRLAGQLDYSAGGHKGLGRRGSHGSHVMHAACALSPGVQDDERPIVCVQLPADVVEDTSGASAAGYIYDGLLYILQRADAIAADLGAGPLKVVANLSFGNIAGPHDGSSLLESAIDQLLEEREASFPAAPLRVVLPAGNFHLARCHARHVFTSVAQRRRMRWVIQPDDVTSSEMQLWLPHPLFHPELPALRLRVRPPGGAWSPLVSENQVLTGWLGGTIVFAMTYLGAALTGDRATVRFWMAPTVTHHPERPVAPSGTWEVELRRAAAGRRFEVHAWIQRDDRPYGYPIRGRQSRFDDPRYLRKHPVTGRDVEVDQPGAYVRRYGSINAYATGRETVVIGGFRHSDFRAWKSTAGGPIILAPGYPPPPAPPPPVPGAPHRDGPDAMAPSEDSPALHGRIAAGTRSGSAVAMNGTSVAAPQVARLVADLMAGGAPGDRAQIRALAQLHEGTARPTPPPDKQRGGEGRLDLPPPDWALRRR
jgi:hypothetical protein